MDEEILQAQAPEDPLAEVLVLNICDYNRENLELATRTQLMRMRKKQNIILLVLCVLMVIYNLVMIILRRELFNIILGSVSLLLLALVFYTMFGIPRLLSKKQVEQIKELNNGTTRFRTALLDDEIITIRDDDNISAHVPYAALKDLVREEGLLLLFTKANQLLMFDPNGFQKGSEQELRRLLAEKAPGIRL